MLCLYCTCTRRAARWYANWINHLPLGEQKICCSPLIKQSLALLLLRLCLQSYIESDQLGAQSWLARPLRGSKCKLNLQTVWMVSLELAKFKLNENIGEQGPGNFKGRFLIGKVTDSLCICTMSNKGLCIFLGHGWWSNLANVEKSR